MQSLYAWEESLCIQCDAVSPDRRTKRRRRTKGSFAKQPLLSYTDALSNVHAGTMRRSEARAWLVARPPPVTPSELYAARVLRAFAESQPPVRKDIHPHSLSIRARELAASQGETNTDPCLDFWALGPIASSHFERLDRAFGPDCPARKRKRCEYCRVNDSCMVRGCPLTPVGSSTVDSTARFRCVPGMHLCNAHGLQLLTNRQTVVTDNVMALKGGRFARNVFEGLVTKQIESGENDEARQKRRLLIDVALVREALEARPELSGVDASTALCRLMDDNAPSPLPDPVELSLF